MKKPQHPERPPFNNLDLFDHRPVPQGMEALFDEIPYEPTLEEVYADSTQEELGRLAFESFFDKGVFEFVEKSPSLKEIGQMTGLTWEQETVLGSLRLIFRELMNNHRSWVNPNAQMSDRVQNANLYAVSTVNKFDEDECVHYFSFIFPHFANQVYRPERGASPNYSHGSLIRVTPNVKITPKNSQYYVFSSLLARYRLKLGEFIEPEDVVDLCEEATSEMLESYKSLAVEHVPFVPEQLEERFVDDDNDEIDSTLTYSQEGINQLLGTLDPKQKRSIELYFGFNGGNPRSSKSIAEKEGVTRQAVHHRIKKGLIALSSVENLEDIISGAVVVSSDVILKKSNDTNKKEAQKLVKMMSPQNSLMSSLKEHKITAKSIADEIGIDSSYLSAILSGRIAMKPDMPAKLFLAVEGHCRSKLGMSLQDFIELKGLNSHSAIN